MRTIINGKLVSLPDDATVESVRASKPSEFGSDQFLAEKGGVSKPLRDSDTLKDGDKIYTIPKIVKGRYNLS